MAENVPLPRCRFECDRDRNAALNHEHLAVSSAVAAYEEKRSGAIRESRVKRASVKQELNGKIQLSSD
jgi:hypothetical protein